MVLLVAALSTVPTITATASLTLPPPLKKQENRKKKNSKYFL
jgi:hypothetical protein